MVVHAYGPGNLRGSHSHSGVTRTISPVVMILRISIISFSCLDYTRSRSFNAPHCLIFLVSRARERVRLKKLSGVVCHERRVSCLGLALVLASHEKCRTRVGKRVRPDDRTHSPSSPPWRHPKGSP